MSENFDINIKTSSDLADAKAAEEQMRGLKDSTKGASDAAKQHSEAQAGLNRTLNESAQAGQGLGAVSEGVRNLASGNVLGGVHRLTAGLKALWATMVANPVGAVIAGVVALATALFQMKSRQEEAQKAAEEAARANAEYARQLAETAATVTQKMDEVAEATRAALGAANAPGAADGFDAVAKLLAQAADDATRMRLQMEAAADLDLAATMADIELRESREELSKPDAELARQQARVAAAEARAAAQRRELEERVRIADEKRAAAERELGRRMSATQAAEEENKKVEGDLDKVFGRNRRPEELRGELEVAQARLAAEQKTMKRWQRVSAQSPATAAAVAKKDVEIQALSEQVTALTRAIELIEQGALQKSQNRLTKAAEAQGAAAGGLDTAKAEQAKALKDASFGLSVLDRKANISQVDDQAKRQQIENQRKEEAARAEEQDAAAKEKDAAEKARLKREADQELERFSREAHKRWKEEEEAAQAEVDRRTRDFSATAPVLPGDVTMRDRPGLGSSKQVKEAQAKLNEGAQAINTFKEQALADGVVSQEEVQALYALLDEFIALARQFGTSQRQSISQAERLRVELTELREAQRNMP